jgi:hypothetical protein
VIDAAFSSALAPCYDGKSLAYTYFLLDLSPFELFWPELSVAIVPVPAPTDEISRLSPISVAPDLRAVIIVAILDASSPFAYFLQVSPIDLWYTLTLSIKIAIFLISMRSIRLGRLSAFSLYGVVAIILISSAAAGAESDAYLKVFAFVASLFLTLSMVRRDNLPLYVLTCVYTIGISTLVYIAAVQMGSVPAMWGRFAYFGGSAANLGSEIIAISIVLATCVLSPLRLLFFSVPSLYALNLMEGRSGLIVSLIAVVVTLYFSIERPQNRSIVIVTAISVTCVTYLFFSDNVYTYFNSILLVDDEYRGVNTGFVGRDKLWEGAWNCFIQSPIIGNGVGFGERLGVEAHNFFLYGLSQFGMMSLLIFGLILYLYYDMYRTNPQWLYGLASVPILMMFNDRFFNLNPYPFLLYVVLFAHADGL